MADVYVGNGLQVSDLINSTDLNLVTQHRNEITPIFENENSSMSDLQIHSSLQIVDAQQWATRLNLATRIISQQHQLDEKWIPIFFDIQKLENERYLIPFISQEKSENIRWIETADSTFIEFYLYMNEKIKAINENHSFNGHQLQLTDKIEPSETMHGLNAIFCVQTLIQSISNNNRNSIDNEKSVNLTAALKIHSYVSYAMMAQGAIHDTAKIIKLVHTLWQRDALEIKNTLNNFTLSLANSANEGLNTIFNMAQIGLDIYELANANNEGQQAVFGTQLAFDSMTFAAGVAGTYAGMIGASATAISSVGVVISGLGIGFTALTKAFTKVADDAKSVGVYFDYLDKAYQDNGYDYQQENEILIPLFGAVFKTINLHVDTIEFDSQYIYPTRENSAGGGRHNYIFWAGNFPHSLHDRAQALNIRDSIGYHQETHDIPDCRTIILPITPKSYIDYSYNILPGATTRNDKGFNVIRRIEQSDRFDYDFYVFPFENIITNLTQEYIYTSIEVILPDDSQTLIIPNISNEWHGKLHYNISGRKNEYHIHINYGATLTLYNHTPNNTPATWIIDTSSVNNTDVIVSENSLLIDGIKINIDKSSTVDNIKLVNKQGEVRTVNLAQFDTSIIAEDGNQWIEGSQDIEQYLNKLSESHQPYEKYIIINNYHYNGTNVGRAFYDVENERVIFTNSTNEENHYALLGAEDDLHAYFYASNKSLFWRVNIETGEVNMHYDVSSTISNESKIIRLWNEYEQNYIIFSHRHEQIFITSIYRITDNTIELLAVQNNQPLIKKLTQTSPQLSTNDLLLLSSHNFLTHHLSASDNQSEQLNSTVLPIISDIISITGEDQYGIYQHFWLRVNDGILIKPNLELPPQENNPTQVLSQQQSQWPIPRDLILLGSHLDEQNTEVFFFYSKNNKRFFIQKGLGQDILDVNTPTAKCIDIPNIKEAINWQDHALVSTDDGYIYQVDVTGNYEIVAINGIWFKNKNDWPSQLSHLTLSGKPLTILGLKNNNQLIPAWYYQGQSALFLNITPTNTTKFLGFSKNLDSAFLLDTITGKLYNQKTVNIETLSYSFGDDIKLMQSDKLPESISLYPELTFKNIERKVDGFVMYTESEQLLYHSLDDQLEDKTFSSTLMITGGEISDTITPSLISHVKTLIISGNGGSDTYNFDEECWQNYNTIIIDNYSTDEEIDRVTLPIISFVHTYINKKSEDLILTDIEHNTTLILRKVLSEKNNKYRHLHINFIKNNISINVNELIRLYELHHNIVKLNQLFDSPHISDAHNLTLSMPIIGFNDNIIMSSGNTQNLIRNLPDFTSTLVKL